MDTIFLEMETHILRNDIKIDNDLEAYLYGIKALKRNKGFTDIRVMIMMIKSLSHADLTERRNAVKVIENKVPQSVREMGEKFYCEATRATKLSQLNPKFVLFLLFKTSFVLVTNIFKRGTDNIKNYFGAVGKSISNTFDIERIISSKETFNAFQV